MANLTEQETAMKTDFEKKLQLAEQGDAQAQFHVGLVYTKGINKYQKVLSEISLNEFPYPVKHDDNLAFQWFEKAAKQGNTDAQYFLGVCYSKGCGVKQDYAQAVYWHKKAAEQGNRNSQNILGFYYYSEQDYQQAIDWFKKAAEQGDYFAQYRLACCYRDGVGVEQNNQLTFEWFNKCAESYVPFSHRIFLKSDSWFYVDISFFKDRMCDDIYYRVADCYFNGVGIEANQKEGIGWIEFGLSINRYFVNRYSVPENVDLLYDEEGFLFGITPGESEKKLIQQWITEANQGNIETQYRLAVTCFDDNDYSDALRFLNDALKNNHPAAHQWLEEAYLHIAFPYLTDRTDAEQYYQAAFEYCSNEANRESEEVYFCLGVLYACGKGVEQNKELAFRNFSHIVNETGFRLNPFDEYDELQILAEYYLLVTNYYDGNNKGDEQFLWDYVQTYFKFLAGVFNKNTTLHHPVLPSFTMKTVCEMGNSLCDEMGDFESARKRFSSNRDRMLKEVCSHIIDKEEQLYKKNKELEEKNKALELALEAEKVSHKKLHEKEQEMISFFTHTLRNALASAPESLRQAIRLLGSEDYEKNKKYYKAINKITALFSTLSLTDCLIDTFKQSINDPEEFKLAWQKDNTGDATPKWVIASALRQSLNRIIFMSDASQLEKLLNVTETSAIVSTRKSFIETVLPLNVDNQGINTFYDWLNGINTIEISIEETNHSNFGINQVKFSLLFAITSEILLNALKYWNGTGHIQISWQLIEENYIFTVKNPCHANASSNLAGTHKGIAFINRLMELLGDQAHFNCIPEEQLFTAQLKLHKSLLGDNT